MHYFLNFNLIKGTENGKVYVLFYFFCSIVTGIRINELHRKVMFQWKRQKAMLKTVETKRQT